MVDYSEVLLSIKRSMDSVHKALLSGKIDVAKSYADAAETSIKILKDLIHNTK